MRCRGLRSAPGLVSDEVKFRGESLETAARRELLEETGYEAEALQLVGEWPTSCGMTSETVHVFRASGVRRVAEGGGDELEDITVHLVPVDKAGAFFEAKRSEGCLIDSKVFASLWYFISHGGRN